MKNYFAIHLQTMNMASAGYSSDEKTDLVVPC